MGVGWGTAEWWKGGNIISPDAGVQKNKKHTCIKAVYNIISVAGEMCYSGGPHCVSFNLSSAHETPIFASDCKGRKSGLQARGDKTESHLNGRAWTCP